MPPKRKSNVLDALDAATVGSAVELGNFDASATVGEGVRGSSSVPAAISKDDGAKEPAKKKTRTSNSGENSMDISSTSKGKASAPKLTWQDIELPGEAEGNVEIYDDCNDIRRKIRALQKEPGFKITHWLRDIGGINSNSFGRFMKKTGRSGGAENGVYPAAYIFFEKRRIVEGKKKTPGRLRNEDDFPGGFPRIDGKSKQWVLTPPKWDGVVRRF